MVNVSIVGAGYSTNAASEITYRQILSELDHTVAMVYPHMYDFQSPDLSQHVADARPDVFLLSTQGNMPLSEVSAMYDHLKSLGKPVIIADLNAFGRAVPEIDPNDAYFNAFHNRRQPRQAIQKSLAHVLR